MGQFSIPNRLFFYSSGFAVDCFNYIAILAETFLASSLLGVSEFQMGLLGACSALGYALPCVWTGLLSERVGRRTMLLVAIALMGSMYVAAPHAGSLPMLCLISFTRSVGTSCFWPPLMAWMTETSDRGSLSGILGGYNVSWTLGIIAGFWICGITYEQLGPAAPFHIAALFAAVWFVFVLLCTPRRIHLEPHAEEMTAHDARFFVRQGLMLNTLAYFLTALILYLFPKMVGVTLGARAQSMLHVARMAGQLVAFSILTHTDAWHYRRWPVWLCLGLFAFGMAVVGGAHWYVFYALGFVAVGLGNGVGYTLSAYYALALMKTKGLGSGIQESLIGAGNLAGPLYGGILGTPSSPRASMFAALVPIGFAIPFVCRGGERQEPVSKEK